MSVSSPGPRFREGWSSTVTENHQPLKMNSIFINKNIRDLINIKTNQSKEYYSLKTYVGKMMK
jgi:hypothetical protein